MVCQYGHVFSFLPSIIGGIVVRAIICQFSFFLAPSLPFCPKATSQFAWSCPRLYAVVSLPLFNIYFLELNRGSSMVLQGTNCSLAEL